MDNPTAIKLLTELRAKVDELEQALKAEPVSSRPSKAEQALFSSVDPKYLKQILDNPQKKYYLLGLAFSWTDTPQGYNYWYDLCYGNTTDRRRQPLSDDDIVQLQNWLIGHYEQKLLKNI